MKILYSAGNRFGAALQAKRFIEKTEHEVKIAAYSSASYFFDYIDWTLDALEGHNPFNKGYVNELFGKDGAPFVEYEPLSMFFDDLIAWEPDLVICDAEKIVANIAIALDVPLWYCSPLHLLDGTAEKLFEWPAYKNTFYQTARYVKELPVANKYLVYSFMGDLPMRPILKTGYHWIKPYHQKPEQFQCLSPERRSSKGLKLFERHFNNYFCTGDTSSVADILYSNNHAFISPSPDDPEETMNAVFCEMYGVGTDLAAVDSVKYASRTLDRLTEKEKITISEQKHPYLHEVL